MTSEPDNDDGQAEDQPTPAWTLTAEQDADEQRAIRKARLEGLRRRIEGDGEAAA
jgi:hypothetical protein